MMQDVRTTRHRSARAGRSSRSGSGQVQARALLMYGRWSRLGRRGVAVVAGCICGFDAAIELGELDDMVLDYLGQRHSGHTAAAQFIAGFAQDGQPQGLRRLLHTLVQGGHGLDERTVSSFLVALEPTILSIEEQHV